MNPLLSIVVRVLALGAAATLAVILAGSCYIGARKEWRKTRPISTYGGEVLSLHSGHDPVPGGPA